MLMHGWLQIGDASGSHSPLSFGGFGSMLRHLRRLHQGIHAALQQDVLDVGTLKGLQVKPGPFPSEAACQVRGAVPWHMSRRMVFWHADGCLGHAKHMVLVHQHTSVLI